MTPKERMKLWYINNKEKHKAKRKEYYQANKEKQKQQAKEWAKNNREKQCKYSQNWKEKNKEKYLLQLRIYGKKWYAKNKHYYIQKAAKRNAKKLQRTPKWADLEAIAEFYKNCPEGYHVDHIIPLQGKNVSGFHILENLQYLPAKENLRKRNKF